MRAQEFEKLKNKPIVYVDMDGVLADLFNYAGGLHNVEHYTHITNDQWEEFFKNSNAYDLFRSLPVFPTANKLLQIVKQYAGGYTILSSPLNFDRAGSIKGKREWLSKHITVPPNDIKFEHEKYKYATQPDGTPNILIDDFNKNIRAWRNAGGIGIKYQSDEDSLDKIVKGLAHAQKIIKGEEQQEPQIDTPNINETVENLTKHKNNILGMFEKFLPLAMHYLGLKSLPTMKFEMHIQDKRQPTFGKYENGENTLYVALMNRNPNDILRTVAHELVHYKQDTKHQLVPDSGRTGSPHENEANAVAGIVMRHFNKKYPEYLNSKPITENFTDGKDLQGVAENFADGKGPGKPGDSQRHGIPKKATMSQLQKAAKAKGRKGQLARWQINMRRGKKK